MKSIRRNFAWWGMLLPFLFLCSCAEFHVQIPVTNNPNTSTATPGSNYNGTVTTWSFCWGLFTDGGVQVPNCNECGMQEVTTTRDFWQGLCSIVTLGIATPMNVQWKCQAAPAREGSLSSAIGHDHPHPNAGYRRNREAAVHASN